MAALPPKWICGYSDITTLTFPLTLYGDFATVHGAQFIDMGLYYPGIDKYDLAAFEAMSNREFTQRSSEEFRSRDSVDNTLKTEKTVWKSLDGKENHVFHGRMIGGCVDVLCKLIGTRFALMPDFLEKYRNDGFIWALESCEMWAGEIYRTLWQMRECGWFEHCNGILYGRPAGYSEKDDFKLCDALQSGLACLNVPVIYDADIGHIPPKLQIINGAYGKVEYDNGKAVVTQQLRS